MNRGNHAAERRAVKAFGRRGNDILRERDPLGLIAAGAPADEYDCVVTGVMVELIGERESSLPVWITEHFDDHFGATPDRRSVREAADDFVALWRSEELAALRR